MIQKLHRKNTIMKNLIILIVIPLCQFCMAENQGKPKWWHTIRDCDVCFVASLVTVDKSNKESLVDSKNQVIAEFYPVKLKVDRVLFISPRMTFDGRFLKNENQEFFVIQEYVNLLPIYLLKKISGEASVVDTHFIGNNPKLSTNGIFTIVRTGHKKNGEFIITSQSGLENEIEYIKAAKEVAKQESR